jgi:hypothetical protein
MKPHDKAKRLLTEYAHAQDRCAISDCVVCPRKAALQARILAVVQSAIAVAEENGFPINVPE